MVPCGIRGSCSPVGRRPHREGSDQRLGLQGHSSGRQPDRLSCELYLDGEGYLSRIQKQVDMNRAQNHVSHGL